jgi:hypothetical protein
MRRLFNLRAFNGLSSSNGQHSRSKSVPIATIYSGALSRGKNGTKDGSRIMASNMDHGETNSSWWDREGRISRSESEEYIVGGNGGEGRKGNVLPLEIWESRQVDVEVDRGSVSAGQGMGMVGEMRTKMYDGSGKGFETRTVVTAQNTGLLGRKSESGSRSS